MVSHILEHFNPPKNAYEKTRLDCALQINAMYAELEDWKTGFSGARVAQYGRAHCSLYAELAKYHLEAGAHLNLGWGACRIYPKHHLFIHGIEDQVKVTDSPRDVWCYPDESAIGDATKLAASLHPRAIHRSVMEKYRV